MLVTVQHERTWRGSVEQLVDLLGVVLRQRHRPRLEVLRHVRLAARPLTRQSINQRRSIQRERAIGKG